MIDILLIFYKLKDKIAISNNFYAHFWLILDTYRFCLKSRANPPMGPLSPPMPKSVWLTLTGGGQMTHRRKLAVPAISYHSKQHKTC